MREVVEVLLRVLALKRIRRTGRSIVGIPEPETVASHSFSVALIAMILADLAASRGLEVNVEKLLRMAILHDVPEAFTGDIPSPARKTVAPVDDLSALRIVLAGLPEDLLKYYSELLEEFLSGSSIEARLARAADKIDQAIQALEYFRLFGLERLRNFSRFEGDEIPVVAELKQILSELFEWSSRTRS